MSTPIPAYTRASSITDAIVAVLEDWEVPLDEVAALLADAAGDAAVIYELRVRKEAQERAAFEAAQ